VQNRIPDPAIQNLDQQILQIQSFHQQLEKKIKTIELSMKDLTDVKFKQVSEDTSRKIANFKQEIDQQLRLSNDNLIKSEDKTKEIL
jgi:negative regulator of sigma E activity